VEQDRTGDDPDALRRAGAGALFARGGKEKRVKKKRAPREGVGKLRRRRGRTRSGGGARVGW
jgi:hypothetical protein